MTDTLSSSDPRSVGIVQEAEQLLKDVGIVDGTQLMSMSEEGPAYDARGEASRSLHSLCVVGDPFDYAALDAPHHCFVDVAQKTEQESALRAKQIEAAFRLVRTLLSDLQRVTAEKEQLQAELEKAKQVRNRAERDRVKAESHLREGECAGPGMPRTAQEWE